MKYHQSKQEKHDHRLTKLQKVEDKYNYDGVSYPADFQDIKQFELNNGLAVFVYGINEKGKIET